jgi:DNA mismatch repair ATPase MutS
VGEIELLTSMSAFAFNNSGYTYPLLHESMQLTAHDVAHPLIPANVSVPNSIVVGDQEKLVILTGSNMSGKTTFLRTLGVNLVLAQCGAPVNARHFSFRPMAILSSIRVGDSLQENTSYFMAELKKLHRIIEVLQTGQPALVLIDEILRGTNSDDKTHGSEQFIRKLINFNCLTLFATHDLSLSVLENELTGRVSNYCFESIISQGELLFDYSLQRGVARNKNASFLMEKMGII